MPPCLTLSIISYRSRVKWGNPKNGVALLTLHLGLVAIEKRTFRSPSTKVPTLLFYDIKKNMSNSRNELYSSPK